MYCKLHITLQQSDGQSALLKAEKYFLHPFCTFSCFQLKEKEVLTVIIGAKKVDHKKYLFFWLATTNLHHQATIRVKEICRRVRKRTAIELKNISKLQFSKYFHAKLLFANTDFRSVLTKQTIIFISILPDKKSYSLLNVIIAPSIVRNIDQGIDAMRSQFSK